MCMAGAGGAVDAVEPAFAEVDVVLADVVAEELCVPAGGAGVVMAEAVAAAAGALVAAAGAGAGAGAGGAASGICEI